MCIKAFEAFLFFEYLGDKEKQIIHLLNWFSSGNFIVDWSIRLDSLTTTMFVVVCNDVQPHPPFLEPTPRRGLRAKALAPYKMKIK